MESARPGNGVASLPAREVLARARTAAQAQPSVRLVGSVGTGEDAFGIDLRVRRDGGAAGGLSFGGVPVELVADAGEVFIRADRAYWEGSLGADAADRIGDRWLRAPADDPSVAAVAAFADYDATLDDLLSPDGSLTVGAPREVAGRPAVPVDSADERLWVATTGDPLPLRLAAGQDPAAGSPGGVASGSASGVASGVAAGVAAGAIDLTEWGAPVAVVVPTGDDVVALGEL